MGRSKKKKARGAAAGRPPVASPKSLKARQAKGVPLSPAGRRRVRIASQVVEHINAHLGADNTILLPARRIVIVGPNGKATPVGRKEIEEFLLRLVRAGKVTGLAGTPEGFSFTVVRNQPTQRPRRPAQSKVLPQSVELPDIEDVMREVLIAVDRGAARHADVRTAVARTLEFDLSAATTEQFGDSLDKRVGACLAAHKGLGHIRHEGAVISILPSGRARLVFGNSFEGNEIPERYRRQTTSAQPARHNPEGTARTAERLVVAIPNMAPDRLVSLWTNANRILSNPARSAEHEAAIKVVDAVEIAWDALELADDELFPWPSTEIGTTTGASTVSDFRSEGMLSYLEYRVGKNAGLHANARQSILVRAFEGRLPRVFEPAYMNEWGQPGSAQRLRKMAESLAAFARNFKRLDQDRYDEAIRNWEQDLDFLYCRYYLGRFGFGWPTTSINGPTLSPR